MKKKCLLFFAAALMLGTLTGCFRSVDELFTLPKLPEEYQNLQEKIEEVTTGTGAEYAAPIMGANNQPVQLQDLDGDGVMEALAFFRVSASGDDKPLKIYIFRLTEEGYELGTVIEGEGSAINSISYEDVCGGPSKELVVSWLVSGNAYVLSVYSIEHYQATEMLRTGYTSFELQDLDMDNRKEIAVVRLDTIEGKSRVEFYDAEENDPGAPVQPHAVPGCHRYCDRRRPERLPPGRCRGQHHSPRTVHHLLPGRGRGYRYLRLAERRSGEHHPGEQRGGQRRGCEQFHPPLQG